MRTNNPGDCQHYAQYPSGISFDFCSSREGELFGQQVVLPLTRLQLKADLERDYERFVARALAPRFTRIETIAFDPVKKRRTETWRHKSLPEVQVTIVINEDEKVILKDAVPSFAQAINKYIRAKWVMQQGVAVGSNKAEYGRVLRSALESHEGISFEIKDTNIHVSRDTHPELLYVFQISSHVTPGCIPSMVASSMRNLDAQITMLDEHYAELKRYGCVLTRADGVLTLDVSGVVPIHIDYKKQPLTQKTAMVRLDDFQQEVEKTYNTWLHRLYALKAAGFRHQYTPEKAGNFLVINHEDKRFMPRRASVLGERCMFGRAAQDLIKDIGKAKLELLGPLPPVTSPVPVARRAPADSLKKLVILFDNSALGALGTLRTGSRTWLDFLPIASYLPNTEIIITAYNHFEATGRTPVIDASGNLSYIRIDPYADKAYGAKERDAFYDDCSNSYLDMMGHRRVRKGKFEKTVIWHSAAQDLLFARLHEIKQEFGHSRQQLFSALCKFRSYRGARGGNDKGELSCVEYAHSPECTQGAVIVNRDQKFSERLKSARELRTMNNLLFTGGNNGIGTATAVGFLRAMTDAFGCELADLLNEDIGGHEPDAKLQRIVTNMGKNPNLNDRSLWWFYGEEVPGVARNGTLEPTLADALAQGVKLWRAGLKCTAA